MYAFNGDFTALSTLAEMSQTKIPGAGGWGDEIPLYLQIDLLGHKTLLFVLVRWHPSLPLLCGVGLSLSEGSNWDSCYHQRWLLSRYSPHPSPVISSTAFFLMDSSGISYFYLLAKSFMDDQLH